MDATTYLGARTIGRRVRSYGRALVRCAPSPPLAYLVGLAVLTSSVFLFTDAPAVADGPYRGRVIDTETKAPLVAAVVLIYWNRESPGIGHGPTETFLGAEEALTDERGSFVIARNPPQTLIPGTWRSKPFMTIFYPGYNYFPRHYKIDPPIPGRFTGVLKIMETSEVTFELPRLQTREQRLMAVWTVNPLVIPRSQMPNLVRLLNIERRALHLTTLE